MEGSFLQIKHVILDEVQNFQGGDWLEEARKLVRQHPPAATHDEYASDNESVSDLFSESETEEDNSDTNSVAGLDPESSICQNYGPGYLWCFIDKGQGIYKSKAGIPQRLPQTFILTKVIRNSKRIFKYAEIFLDRRIWPRSQSVTIGHDFDGEQSEVGYSKGERIACLSEVVKSLLEEGYSKGDIAVLYLSKLQELNEREQVLQEFPSIVKAERNDDDNNIVLSTVEEYGGLERPVVIIADESSDSLRFSRLYYCGLTRGMVKLITLARILRGQKRKQSN